MKRLSIFIFSMIACISMAQAQNKVAVFDPVGDLPSDAKTFIREKISSVITGSLKYRAVERSMIAKVLEENKFQSQGLVDENQLTELGRKAGADLVCIIVVLRLENECYVSVKLVNLASAKVQKQQTGQTEASSDKVETLIEELASEIFIEN